MSSSRSRLVAALFCIVLSSTPGAGAYAGTTPIDAARLQGFVVGQTTYAEVVAALGKPDATQPDYTGAGGTAIVYTYLDSGRTLFSYAPFVSSAATRPVRFQQVMIWFDQQGRYQRNMVQQVNPG